MSNSFKRILASMLFSWSALGAQLDYESYGSEPFVEPQKEQGPFTLKITGDAITHANFKKWYIDDQHLQYSVIDFEASGTFYYNKRYKEGAIATIGYMDTNLNWQQNPFFRQTSFHTVTFSLTAFTDRITNWRWTSQVTFNVNPNHFSLSPYTTYDLFLWGRYTYCENVHIHTGFLAETGMKIDRVYPIVGFDWTINEKWALNVVYPVNISIVYTYNKIWSASIASRFFDSRQRVGKGEPLPRGLWKYRATGVEFGVDYEKKGVKANIHVGEAFGSRLTISNRHNKHKRHFSLNSSPYFGGEVAINF